MFDPFQNQLKKVTAKYNLARTFKAIEICQEYRTLAPEILREDALKNSFPKWSPKRLLMRYLQYENRNLLQGVYQG